jgi:hypothetical protein
LNLSPLVFFPRHAQVLFAKQNRAQVRSVTLSGVNSAGHSVFTTPPLFDSAFGHAFATQVPVVNWMTLVSDASCDAPQPSQPNPTDSILFWLSGVTVSTCNRQQL